MEIFFSIIAGIFAIAASVFGVKNRIKNSRLGTRRDIRDERGRHTDLVSDSKRLDADIAECSRIGERIRKREQEADVTE